MQTVKKIEHRLPFGFMGDWGKCYKMYTADIQTLIDSGAVEGEDYIHYDNDYYVDIGQDVQFKEASDTTGGIEERNKGSENDVSYITVKTTDSYWNDKIDYWDCIVSNNDIVEVFNQKWQVDNVTTTIVRRTPAMQKVYTIGLTALM